MCEILPVHVNLEEDTHNGLEDGILGINLVKTILSDDGARDEHRYLGHLLRWSEPR